MLAAGGDSVLLGDEAAHAFDLIQVVEYPSSAAAHAALTSPALATLRQQACRLEAEGGGSALLWGERSAAFASLPSFAEAGGESAPTDLSPPRDPQRCPFNADPTANRASWAALESQRSEHMYAFNLLRVPDAQAYAAYSSHFKTLPAVYGMKFVEVVSLDPDPAVSVLLGQPPAAAGFDLMALVYFPSSRCFVKSWSDPAIVDEAYPLREGLYEGGFEHVWLRCQRDAAG